MHRLLTLGLVAAITPFVVAVEPPPLRAPAYPLVVQNPYFSTWSTHERLTDDWPRHWSGAIVGMSGLVRVDGHAFRWCGPQPGDVPAAKQTRLDVTATATEYEFEAGGVKLMVRFVAPAIASEPDLASRAVTFVHASAAALDNQPHDVAIYLDLTGEWCTHDPSQIVQWNRLRVAGGDCLGMGTVSQDVCGRTGDQVRIDWGYVHLCVPSAAGGQTATVIAPHRDARQAFAKTGQLPETDDQQQPRPANANWPVLAGTVMLEKVTTAQSANFVISYDERQDVELLNRRLTPYWAREGKPFATMLDECVRKREEIMKLCAREDQRIRERLAAVMPPKLARVCELVNRQVLAANGICADFDGTLLMFAKENTSNGCIATVDVLFPTAPYFLALNPDLLEASLRPIMQYAASKRWKFPFAPHDIGTYPQANAQVYGGGEQTEENQMPVEECGNLLVLTAALAKAKPGWQPPAEWWPVLERWAVYLRANGLDPANQLCTDDFAGHLARNANLAVKAIVALGGYAELCKEAGRTKEASEYAAVAKDYAAKWLKLADAGDHTVLVYEKSDSWSLKYNMFWDRFLGLGLFPAEVRQREITWYKKQMRKFGVPMDNRAEYTKPEWLVWAALLADTRADFDALTTTIFDLADQTPDRVPLTDWYMTTDGHTRGMYARSVVGGLFAPLLLPPAK